jgi:hypothetical protein
MTDGLANWGHVQPALAVLATTPVEEDANTSSKPDPDTDQKKSKAVSQSVKVL